MKKETSTQAFSNKFCEIFKNNFLTEHYKATAAVDLQYSEAATQRCVLRKKCSENVQQIYRRTPMPKCDFNKVAKQFDLP